MTEAANPEIDVEQLMARIREEVARRKRQLGAAENVALPLPQSPPAPPTPPALGDLLRYEGADFVNNAYRAVLRREPDPDALLRREGLV